MTEDPLALALILLAATVVVVTLARRAGLPAILGYLCVGALLGPYAFGAVRSTETTQLLSELGVVFLLFTLGLEFSWPRMVAMRRDVFGIGTAQVVLTATAVAGIAWLLGTAPLPAIAIGGAIAMSSTAIILQQLTEQSEINRTHGRIAFGVLLFQDLAFVPFLVLAGALTAGDLQFSPTRIATSVGVGALAVAAVVFAGRFLLRPMLYEIAHSRLRELFTLAVLMVALGAAWVSHAAGVSMATGAFLAGMMLSETEYRHQIESVIKPFRDILLGLFFVSVGMLLDGAVLAREFWLVAALFVGMLAIKTASMTIAGRIFGMPTFKAVRTGLVLAAGGEFGIAILTILIKDRVLDPEFAQPLLVAVVLSMVASPFILRQNRTLARRLSREPANNDSGSSDAASSTGAAAVEDFAVDVASREHVILCGFGRVGQSMSRVLVEQGHEFVAVDLDPARVRAARAAGLPVLYGDSSDEEVLDKIGLEHASVVVITFADPSVAIGIVQAVRALRADVPILVRAQDDTRLQDLLAAGATEVVPETFEASVMLAAHALLLLRQPMSRVMRLLGGIRRERYTALRGLLRGDHDLPGTENEFSEELKSIVLPPGAWAIGRRLDEVKSRGAAVSFAAVRRGSIVGRDPGPETMLRQGDVVVIYGTPEALEHAETVLLTG
jgi:CPA2 family monovalent cation:H+ antiporter-2